MNQIIKQTRPVGTSAGVLLPRSWLNKQVVVTMKDLDKKDITKEILKILIEKDLLSDVKGIYLTGSYARDEYDANSDVDILVITEKTNKLINTGDYEITLISEPSFSKNLQSSLYNLLSVREATTIMNEALLGKYKAVEPKLDLKKIAKEITNITKINKETTKICKENSRTVPDAIIYSIVLRLRELYLIKGLIKNRGSTKKELLTLLEKGVYEAYVRVKRDKKEINDISPENALKAIKIIEKWLKELKG